MVLPSQHTEPVPLCSPGHYFYLSEYGEAPLITLGGGEGAGSIYIVYSMKSEGLVKTSELYDFLGREYRYNNELVSEEEFNNLLAGYNIDDSRWIRFARKPVGYRDEVPDARPDDTAKILTMTMLEMTMLEAERVYSSIAGSWETAVYVDEKEHILRVESDNVYSSPNGPRFQFKRATNPE